MPHKPVVRETSRAVTQWKKGTKSKYANLLEERDKLAKVQFWKREAHEKEIDSFQTKQEFEQQIAQEKQ